MPISKTIQSERYSAYTYTQSKCLNCGNEIIEGKDLYSRRFCSQECYYEYLL